MEAVIASATTEILIQNLIDISREEISLIRGLNKNAEKLKGTLGMIQELLDDAQKKFIVDAAIKRWLKDLQALAFDADNVLDKLNYQLISNETNNVNPKKKQASCFPSLTHCLNRRQMALKIKEINMSFESIEKKATKLGLERRLAEAPAAPTALTETDSFTSDPIFIGRDDDESKIVDMLTTPAEQALSILPIVGMGGLGKTTLARRVFNHEKTKTFFGQHIWVHVSQEFDAVSLLKKILTNLKGESIEVGSRELLLRKLQETLGAKPHLLVLDDAWNQDQQKWEDFINSWSGITSVMGNVIIVTTRNTEVGSMLETHDVHHLNVLSDQQCWSIIKYKAFREGTVPPGFEAIGRTIAKRCQGLPLAAHVVGGVLHNKSQDEWLSIKENWLSHIGGNENNISRILRLSFDHLPSPSLKKCLAYCSIFPKGERIKRKEMIELWMAEGFLQPSQTSDMESVGNRIFNHLLQNSLLQVVDRDEYGNVKHYSMHNLVHDVAASVLGFPGVNSNGINQTRYVYWKSNGDHISKEQTKWLRTLFYVGDISNIMFSDFKSLHVLTLMDNVVKELPYSIRELIHLRCLNISHTRIKYLPDSIGQLYHMQTVRTPTWSGFEKLPSTIKYLFNLRHLHVHDDTELPPQLGMLTSLRTLPYFKVRNEEGHRIVELQSLKDLKGELKIYNLEKVQGEEESKKADLLRKSGIVTLVLMWDEKREGEINDEDTLRGLQPHPNLKILKILGFKGVSFPSWTLKMAVSLEHRWEGLNNLTEIRLENCEECSEIPSMGQLPLLKFLYLSNLKKLKSIGSSFYGEEITNVFPVLQRLELLDMPNLTEWVEVEIPNAAEVKVFPCLEYLKMKHCTKLKSAPSQFTSLKKLKIKWMDSGLPLESICGDRLKTLTKLKVQNSNGLTSLPHLLFHNNQHLTMLKIKNCPKLIEFPNGIHSLKSLEKLNLKKYAYTQADLHQAITNWEADCLITLQKMKNHKRPLRR